MEIIVWGENTIMIINDKFYEYHGYNYHHDNHLETNFFHSDNLYPESKKWKQFPKHRIRIKLIDRTVWMKKNNMKNEMKWNETERNWSMCTEKWQIMKKHPIPLGYQFLS